MENQIYISYRRDGGSVIAKLICETLKKRGFSVFYDIDTLKGDFFDTRILSTIEECNDFVLVLSPHALDRCVNDNDWVRQEIRHALKYGKNIIPIMLDGFSFPATIPNDIAKITYYNGLRLSMEFFDAFIGKLVENLSDKTKKSQDSFSMTPYKGNDPYIFISYAHKDSKRVLPIIEALWENGFRVWYDAGIEAGTEWPDYIAKNLENAAVVIALLSPSSLDSPNCRQEINYALDLFKPMLSIYLDELKLTGGLRMRLGLSQAIFYHRHKTLDSFMAELCGASILAPCRATTAPTVDKKLDEIIKKDIKPVPTPTPKPTPTPTPTPTPAPTPTPTPTPAPLTVKTDEVLIEDGVFRRYRGSAESYTIPDGVTTISGEAFKDCVTLSRITIPNTVREIYAWAFAGCTALTEIELPKGLTLIASQSFVGSGLTRITIPEGVTAIGRMAFKECRALAEVTLPETLEEIGTEAFRFCMALVEVTVPKNVKTIGEKAFLGCSKLKRVYISPETAYSKETNKSFPGVVKFLAHEAQALAPAKVVAGTTAKAKTTATATSAKDFVMENGVLTKYQGKGGKVTIPDGVTTIGISAFRNCTTVTSVVLPDSVTKIYQRAFAGCTALKSVALPQKLAHIDSEAFNGCTSLTEIIIPTSVTRIGNLVFSRCASLTAITIPDSVSRMGTQVFFGCHSLATITLSKHLKYIEIGTFQECLSLKSIQIPASVTEIGVDAFNGCSALGTISFLASVAVIRENAFWGCTSLKTAYVPKTTKYAKLFSPSFPRHTKIVKI